MSSDRAMTERWEEAFVRSQRMWGEGPALSTALAKDYFIEHGVRNVLIPGVGYGRNAKPFLEAGMSVVGIEISATAIGLARETMGLGFPIHHGSVTDMPYDTNTYDGIFCYGLIYLLDGAARAKLLADCWKQLAPNGVMVFTVISKAAPMYGQGKHLGEDWYEPHPGISMFFYDEAAIAREFGDYGLVESKPIAEPAGKGTFPFFNVFLRRTADGRDRPEAARST